MVKDREPGRAAVRGVTETDTTEWLNNSINPETADSSFLEHLCIGHDAFSSKKT